MRIHVPGHHVRGSRSSGIGGGCNVTMHCEKCVKKINDNVSFEKGVKDLSVSLDKKTVTVTYDPARTDVARLKAAIEKLGYKVTVKE